MIESIRIKNFKASINSELFIQDLVSVNYLVGANGSGKSTILESLFIEIVEQEAKMQMFLNTQVVIENPPDKLKYLVHNNNIIKQDYTKSKLNRTSGNLETHGTLDSSGYGTTSNLDGDLISYSQKDIMDFLYTNSKGQTFNNHIDISEDVKNDILCVLNLFEINDYDDINHMNANAKVGETKRVYKLRNKNDGLYYNINFLAGGYIYLIKLAFVLSVHCEKIKNQTLLICIEEPEGQLHPKFQKLLPELFDYFINKYSNNDTIIKILVSTHSPFLINKSAEFGLKQKVYVIDNGVCLNSKGSSFGGSKRMAMEMLGAGLDDILTKKVVLCESEVRSSASNKPNFQKDAYIYQKLYGEIENVSFFSTGNNNAVFDNTNSFNELINLIFNKQTEKVEIIGFTDRDYVNSNKNTYLTARNTGKFNNIECFLYHDSVLEVLSPGISKYIDFENDRHADKWFNNNLEQIRKISISVDWDESNRNFWKSSFEKSILTEIILNMKVVKNSIFWEMHKNIFGTS